MADRSKIVANINKIVVNRNKIVASLLEQNCRAQTTTHLSTARTPTIEHQGCDPEKNNSREILYS